MAPSLSYSAGRFRRSELGVDDLLGQGRLAVGEALLHFGHDGGPFADRVFQFDIGGPLVLFGLHELQDFFHGGAAFAPFEVVGPFGFELPVFQMEAGDPRGVGFDERYG